MKQPTYVHTRIKAVLTDLGVDVAAVFEHSIDGSGFTMWGEHRDRGIVTYRHDSISTKVPWPDDATRQAALRALHEDFAETMGITPEKWQEQKLILAGLAATHPRADLT